MLRILGLDIETTGLDFKKDEIIEVGYVIREHDGEKWCSKALTQRSLFIWEDHFPSLMPSAAYEIHKMSSKFLQEFGSSYAYQFSILRNAIERFKVDMILGHNVLAFDKPFLEEKGVKLTLPWLDSKVHIEYPKDCKQRSLMYLAAYHGFLNPFPHDALSDVNTLFKIVQNYNFETLVKRASMRMVKVKADVKFEAKDLARARGYQWNGAERHWEKLIPEEDLQKERDEAPFSVIWLE